MPSVLRIFGVVGVGETARGFLLLGEARSGEEAFPMYGDRKLFPGEEVGGGVVQREGSFGVPLSVSSKLSEGRMGDDCTSTPPNPTCVGGVRSRTDRLISSSIPMPQSSARRPVRGSKERVLVMIKPKPETSSVEVGW